MATSSDSRHRYRLVLAVCILGALAVRGAAVMAAPRHAYLMDHVMFMAWSDYAYEHGPAAVYDMPPAYPVWVARGGERIEAVSIPLQCNYPPLATLVFWMQGLLWRQLDDRVATGSMTRRGPHGRPETVQVRSRIVNTRTSRLVNAAAGIVADLLLAWGVLRLVRALLPRPAPGLELAAFALTALAPPIIIDSAFWSQSDGWVSALLVWVMVHTLGRRFWSAGGLYGVALMVKAQAVILAPALAFGVLASARLGGAPRRVPWPAVRALGLGTLLVMLGVGLPFSLAARNGTAGPGAWLERAYLEPVLEQYPYTTTKAFNLWWLEGAVRERPGTLRDSRTRVLGVTKDAIGRGLLALGVLLGIAAAARRFGADPAATVAVACMVSLAAFVLPTRVKARYIYYCLPFLIAMALRFRPWRPVLGAVMIVATAELTWNLWYDITAPVAQGLSVALAGTSVLAFVYALVTLAGGAREETRGAGANHSM